VEGSPSSSTLMSPRRRVRSGRCCENEDGAKAQTLDSVPKSTKMTATSKPDARLGWVATLAETYSLEFRFRIHLEAVCECEVSKQAHGRSCQHIAAQSSGVGAIELLKITCTKFWDFATLIHLPIHLYPVQGGYIWFGVHNVRKTCEDPPLATRQRGGTAPPS
jgi:hypothetical protein